MHMVSVSSSDLNSVGFEKGELYIQFNSGGLYVYSNVPEQVYRELLSASSHGRYFHTHIKNSYSYRKIH